MCILEYINTWIKVWKYIGTRDTPIPDTTRCELLKADIKKEGFKPEDGGAIKLPVNQCFADDMAVVIKETKENIIYIRDIFVEFSEISGLEINVGKTKIIRNWNNHWWSSIQVCNELHRVGG